MLVDRTDSELEVLPESDCCHSNSTGRDIDELVYVNVVLCCVCGTERDRPA